METAKLAAKRASLIVAKRLGKTLRIPATSISFAFSGLDWDLLNAEAVDMEKVPLIQSTLKSVRASKRAKLEET